MKKTLQPKSESGNGEAQRVHALDAKTVRDLEADRALHEAAQAQLAALADHRKDHLLTASQAWRTAEVRGDEHAREVTAVLLALLTSIERDEPTALAALAREARSVLEVYDGGRPTIAAAASGMRGAVESVLGQPERVGVVIALWTASADISGDEGYCPGLLSPDDAAKRGAEIAPALHAYAEELRASRRKLDSEDTAESLIRKGLKLLGMPRMKADNFFKPRRAADK